MHQHNLTRGRSTRSRPAAPRWEFPACIWARGTRLARMPALYTRTESLAKSPGQEGHPALRQGGRRRLAGRPAKMTRTAAEWCRLRSLAAENRRLRTESQVSDTAADLTIGRREPKLGKHAPARSHLDSPIARASLPPGSRQ